MVTCSAAGSPAPMRAVRMCISSARSCRRMAPRGCRRWISQRIPPEVSRIRPSSTDRTVRSGPCIPPSSIARKARTICSIQPWCAVRRAATAAEPGATTPRFSRRRAPSAGSPFRCCPTADGSLPTGSARIPWTACPGIRPPSAFPMMRERAGIW